MSTQSITVGALPTPVYGGPAFSVTATSDSGLPVTIALISGPVTGPIAGPYTPTGPGVVSFLATQAGDANYSAAPAVSFNVTIAPDPLTVTPATAPAAIYNTPYTATFSGVSGSGPPTPVPSGTLPSGIAFSLVGGSVVVSGISTQIGSYPFTIAATDSFTTNVVYYTLIVGGAPQQITYGTLPTPYARTLRPRFHHLVRGLLVRPQARRHRIHHISCRWLKPLHTFRRRYRRVPCDPAGQCLLRCRSAGQLQRHHCGRSG